MTSGISAQTSAIPRAARGAGGNPAGLSALAIAVIAAATLLGAWYFQYFQDIVPCPMCLEQRWAYYGIIPLAILIALLARAGTRAGRARRAGRTAPDGTGLPLVPRPVVALGQGRERRKPLQRMRVAVVGVDLREVKQRCAHAEFRDRRHEPRDLRESRSACR